MTSTSTTVDPRRDVLVALCAELEALARREEDKAAAEESKVPYWLACPPTVLGHRTAARLLREDADSGASVAREIPWTD